jgi:hypothetical protein
MRRLIPGLVACFVGPTLASHADEPKPGADRPAVAPKAADGDAPLPDGWPAATKPGAIEVKRYPAYRSAMARGEGGTVGADDVLFFPLFNHISRKEIAMTSPVVSTYEPAMLDDPKARGRVSMEFLYRSPTQGQAGRGVGRVTVEDHPAATFVCRGIQGRMTAERLRDESVALRAWLAEHKDKWVEDGPPRRLGYHGPMTPEAERLWEIQIPVKPAKTPGPAAPASCSALPVGDPPQGPADVRGRPRQ